MTAFPRTVAEWLTALAWAAMLAGLASCTHRVDTAASSHAEIARTVDATADVVTETRTEQAPGRVTTTVEEFDDGASQEAQAEAPACGLPDVQAAQGRAAQAGAARAGAPQAPTGRLIRRTVRVEERGAVVRETQQEARAATETHEAAHVDSQATTHTATRAGPSPALWLGIGSGAVLLLAAVWHFREPLAKLVRRLCGVPL